MRLLCDTSVSWRAQAGGPSAAPGTYDLAALPAGFGVELQLDCDPWSSTGCTSESVWSGTFSGTLTLAGSYGGYDMTLCLEATPDPNWPNPSGVGQVRLWAEHVVAASTTPTPAP